MPVWNPQQGQSDRLNVAFCLRRRMETFTTFLMLAMEAFIEILEEAESAGDITFDALQIQQLMKALYWHHQGIGFGELIDSLINE